MKNKELLIAQLEHIKEYVEIIDKLDPIEYWRWDYDIRNQVIELIVAGRGEIHRLTIPDIKAHLQIGGTKK